MGIFRDSGTRQRSALIPLLYLLDILKISILGKKKNKQKRGLLKLALRPLWQFILITPVRFNSQEKPRGKENEMKIMKEEREKLNQKRTK